MVYTYSTYFRNPMSNFDLTTLGFPKYMLDQATFKVFPTMAPEGYTDIGTEGWVIMDRQEGVHHFSGSYTKIMGGHNIKVGGEMRQELPRLRSARLSLGSVFFRPGCHLQRSFFLPR